MNKKHCAGCHDNFYNARNNGIGVEECLHFKTAKIVWRIPVGHWENPPYKKRAVRVPDCWHGDGSNRTHYIKKEALDSRGYWAR